MHPAAARVVRQAIAAGGKIDPIAHFDDLVTLDRLAREQQCPSLAEKLHILDQPVLVGEIALYRLSWAAWEWVEQVASWLGDEPIAEMVVPFAMAQARSKAPLAAAADERAARRVLEAWARSLTCSLEALLLACSSLLPEPPADDTKRKAKAAEGCESGGYGPLLTRSDPAASDEGGYGPILARLMQEFGQSPDYWLFEVSFDTVSALMSALSSQDNAARRAAKKGAPADPRSWEVRNFNAFRRFSKDFIAKVTGS